MSVIRNKLRGKDGVSIFMGLMFLLVALMVGTVVLTASTASAGRLADMKDYEQDYLNVASAARMMRDRICKLTYTYKTTDDKLDEGGETLKDSDGKNIILETELKALCGVLAENQDKDDLQSLLDNTGKSFGVFTIKDTNEKLDTVYGSLSMKADGRIIVGLWLKDENGNRRNYMEIEFCPDGPVTDRVVVVTDKPVLNEDGTQKTDEENNPIYETITTVHETTTCSWPESGCTISKGTRP